MMHREYDVIARRLAALRGRQRRFLLVRSLCWTVSLLAIVVGVATVLLSVGFPPDSVRGYATVMTLLGLGLIVVRFGKEWGLTAGIRGQAVRVEAVEAEFRGRLLTAVDRVPMLAEGAKPAPRAVSSVLLGRAVERAARKARASS